MSTKFRLVQGNTRPQIIVALTDANTGEAIDLSPAGTQVLLKFREVGSDVLITTLTATLLPGFERADGSINNAAPYDQVGRGGRCTFQLAPPTLDNEGEFEGEIQVFFNDNTDQTVYDTLKFKVRPSF